MTQRSHRRLDPARWLNALGPLLGLLLIIGLFSITEIGPHFLTGANFKIILIQSVVVIVGALGMTLIIVSGGIDLSVGSVVALSGVATATLLLHGQSILAAMSAALLIGAVVGVINGTVIARFHLMPFIVTLGMMGIARGAAKWFSGSQTVNAPASPLNELLDLGEPTRLFPLPWGVWLALGLAASLHFILQRSVFGRNLFAIGGNETAARFSGVQVARQKIYIYTAGGLFFGLAGLLQFSRLTQGDPSAAIGLELDIIAAVVIGGASLSGGTGSVPGSVIGALIMAVLRNGSNQLGLPTYMQEIIIGVVIILAVGLDKWRQRKASTP